MTKDLLLKLENEEHFGQIVSEEVNYHPLESWMHADEDRVVIEDVEGEDEQITFDEGSKESVAAISWTCATNRGNRLSYNGSPFRARCLSFQINYISWQAGAGWPVYNSYCPQPNYSASMRFRNAKRHQIVPVFAGSYWVGCHSNARACGNRTTDVLFWVNDDKYDDNTGVFRLTVTAWS